MRKRLFGRVASVAVLAGGLVVAGAATNAFADANATNNGQSGGTAVAASDGDNNSVNQTNESDQDANANQNVNATGGSGSSSPGIGGSVTRRADIAQGVDQSNDASGLVGGHHSGGPGGSNVAGKHWGPGTAHDQCDANATNNGATGGAALAFCDGDDNSINQSNFSEQDADCDQNTNATGGSGSSSPGIGGSVTTDCIITQDVVQSNGPRSVKGHFKGVKVGHVGVGGATLAFTGGNPVRLLGLASVTTAFGLLLIAAARRRQESLLD